MHPKPAILATPRVKAHIEPYPAKKPMVTERALSLALYAPLHLEMCSDVKYSVVVRFFFLILAYSTCN